MRVESLPLSIIPINEMERLNPRRKVDFQSAAFSLFAISQSTWTTISLISKQDYFISIFVKFPGTNFYEISLFHSLYYALSSNSAISVTPMINVAFEAVFTNDNPLLEFRFLSFLLISYLSSFSILQNLKQQEKLYIKLL